MPTLATEDPYRKLECGGLILPDAFDHILLLEGKSQKEHTVTTVHASRARCAHGRVALPGEHRDRDSWQDPKSPA